MMRELVGRGLSLKRESHGLYDNVVDEPFLFWMFFFVVGAKRRWFSLETVRLVFVFTWIASRRELTAITSKETVNSN